MRVEEIEIHVGAPERPFRALGPVKAQAQAATALSRAPEMSAVNDRLREKAIELGADAVINVSYARGVSLTSWKALKATGDAVVWTD